MNVVLLPILFLAAYIICCTTAFQSPQQSLIHRRSSELWSDDSSDDRFDVFQDKLDETVLRINFSYDDDDKGNLALSAIQNYTRSFPFVAVLPVQPLTYLPGMNHIIILSIQEYCKILLSYINNKPMGEIGLAWGGGWGVGGGGHF